MLFFDLETECNPKAVEFMEQPTAPKNWKDPEKIKAYIEEKQNEQIDKAALDPDYGKIVAIGVKVNDGVIKAIMDYPEDKMINLFWKLYNTQRGYSCGYNILGFDLPYLMRRSFELGIKLPIRPNLARYRTSPTLDLMMVMYNWYGFKSLKWVAKRYGLTNPLPDLEGSQVATMDKETLRAYVINDVFLTYQLWQKMKGVYF